MRRIAMCLLISCAGLCSQASAQIGIITTIAGKGTSAFSGDGGPATSASLSPSAIAVDASGNLFIADSGNRVRKVSANGVITTAAGNGTLNFSGDGGPATSASFNTIGGVAVDASGNLFIGDTGNNRIRKISTSGVITTIAGNGTSVFSGDGGPATSASLSDPTGVALDAAGNLFIVDSGHNRIRKVSASGIITTVAGGGSPGNGIGDGGPATSASLSSEDWSVAVDGSGNLFIADLFNQRVRKVSVSGIITTVAGGGNTGNGIGDGGPATSASLFYPEGVTVKANGELFIADTYNNRVRKVSASGIITTVAGNGTAGFSGDGGPATLAEMNHPFGLALDSSGNLSLSDLGNNRVRKILPSLTVSSANITLSLAAGEALSQQISLTSSAPNLTWTATTLSSFIKLGSTSGTGSGTITFTVNTTSLQPGTYAGSVTISNPSASPQEEIVNVSLTVTATATLSLAPSSQYFLGQQGSGAQSNYLQIGGTTGTAWQATVATATGGAWLNLSATAGQIPASLSVKVNTGALTPGTYQGSITVSAAGTTPSSGTINVTLVVTAPGSQTSPPYVSSANNSADYSATIARGSLFVVFGQSLGPANLVQVSAFPLPNALSGTSVTVTSGSTTLNCPMIYTSSRQVAAILPSNTPVGIATVSVTYNGIEGPPGYQTITVAKSSVGLFTTNSRGVGTGVFTAVDGTLKTYANSAKPGDVLTMWATGLGPITTPDNVLPTSYPNFPNVQVWVGGQAAQVAYAGRSGCCSAVDQIAFTVPAVATGCNLPVTVVSGATPSNTVTLPVSALGGACSDTGPTLPTSILTKAAAGQPVKVAGIAMGPEVFGNSAGASRILARSLSSAFHTPVSEAEAAKLKRAYASRNPKTIRRAMIRYASRWKTLDARTKASIAAQIGQTQEGVAALFGRLSNEGVAAMIGSALLPTPGACVILPKTYPAGLGAISGSLDAGTSLLLTGAGTSLSLKQTRVGQYGATFGSSLKGPNIPLGPYTVSGTGGKDVGAFSATITVGSHLAIANKSSLATVDRTQPVTVTWTGGTAGNYVLIIGNSPGNFISNISNANFACAEDAAKGTFTVPSYILSSLNATASGKGTLLISPHPLSNQITIPGIDLAYFADGSSDSTNVTFK